MSLSPAQMVTNVRHYLDDNPFVDFMVTASINTSVVNFDVPDGTIYDKGAVLEFQTAGEQVLITDVNADTLTVTRGYNGTTPATHTSSEAFVRDPNFQYIQITSAVTKVVDALWPYIAKKITCTVTPTTGTQYYNVVSGSTVLDMRQLSSAYQYTGTPARPFFYGAVANSYPIRSV